MHPKGISPVLLFNGSDGYEHAPTSHRFGVDELQRILNFTAYEFL